MNSCMEVNGLAERELNAFYHAVRKRFGKAEAERSAREWIGELASRAGMPRTMREWREITVEVTKRLAIRSDAIAV